MNLHQIKAFVSTLEAEELPSEDGTPYTTRYTVRKTEQGSVYIQNIHRPDRDPALHSHPWSFMRSTVLHGRYLHERGSVYQGKYHLLGSHILVKAGESYEMSDNHVHRIWRVEPDTWTLLIVGPKVQEWFFWVEGRGVVPWQERFKERGVKTR